MFLAYDQETRFAVVSIMRRQGVVIDVAVNAGTHFWNATGAWTETDLSASFKTITEAYEFCEKHGRHLEWRVEWI